MCIKGFVYCLSYDCQIDIDCDVLTTYCRSSSGGSVNLCCSCKCFKLSKQIHQQAWWNKYSVNYSLSTCATMLVDEFILTT